MKILVAVFVLIPLSAFAESELSDECHGLGDDNIRLACYDRVSNYSPDVEIEVSNTEVSEPEGRQWRNSKETSALDGRTDVWLSIASKNRQPNQIGNLETATFWVRCMENKTNAFVTFNSYTSDTQTVRFRLDEGTLSSVRMEPMNGGDGLGLWSGGSAIPFIKSIFGADELVIGYDSYSANNLEFQFNVSGLRARIDDLAESCGWQP